jgi:hypothetical protein
MRLVSFDLEGLKKEAALIAKQFRLYDKYIRDFGLGYNHGVARCLTRECCELARRTLNTLVPWATPVMTVRHS